jgi:hypothetical protein
MMQINGKITTRLLALLKAGKLDQSAIHPGRPADAPPPKKAKKLPRGVDGQSLGKRGKK